MKGIPAVLLLVACAVVVLSSFLPWVQFQLQIPAGFEMQGMEKAMSEAMVGNGWHGNVTLLGATVPNWFVPVLAVVIAALALMRGAEVWESPPALSITAAAYCVAHLGLLCFVAVMATEARVRFGAPLGLIASVSALAITVFSRPCAALEVRTSRSSFERYGEPRCLPTQDDVPAPPGFGPRPRSRV